MCEFISYAETRQFLADKLNATEESIAYEIAAWVGLRSIAAYQNVKIVGDDGHLVGDRDRFYFDDNGRESKNFEYLSKLEKCHFKRAEVEAFEPSDRYITGLALIERWAGSCGGEDNARAKIRSYCRQFDNQRLKDYFPGYGGTHASVGESDYDLWPPFDMALFKFSEVLAIETSGFPVLFEGGNQLTFNALKQKKHITKSELLAFLRKQFLEDEAVIIAKALEYTLNKTDIDLTPGKKNKTRNPGELIQPMKFIAWLEEHYKIKNPLLLHKLKYGNSKVLEPPSIDPPDVPKSLLVSPKSEEALRQAYAENMRAKDEELNIERAARILAEAEAASLRLIAEQVEKTKQKQSQRMKLFHNLKKS